MVYERSFQLYEDISFSVKKLEVFLPFFIFFCLIAYFFNKGHPFLTPSSDRKTKYMY